MPQKRFAFKSRKKVAPAIAKETTAEETTAEGVSGGVGGVCNAQERVSTGLTSAVCLKDKAQDKHILEVIFILDINYLSQNPPSPRWSFSPFSSVFSVPSISFFSLLHYLSSISLSLHTLSSGRHSQGTRCFSMQPDLMCDQNPRST